MDESATDSKVQPLQGEAPTGENQGNKGAALIDDENAKNGTGEERHEAEESEHEAKRVQANDFNGKEENKPVVETEVD